MVAGAEDDIPGCDLGQQRVRHLVGLGGIPFLEAAVQISPSVKPTRSPGERSPAQSGHPARTVRPSIWRAVCCIAGSVLYCGQCAVLRAVCCIAGSVLYCGQCAVLRAVCCIAGSVLYCGQCAVLRAVCCIAGSVLYCGQCAGDFALERRKAGVETRLYR